MEVGEDLEYKAKAFKSSKFQKHQLKYLVAWKSFTEAGYSWISAKEYDNYQFLVDEYHKKFPAAAGPKRQSGSSNPPILAAMKLIVAQKLLLANIPSGRILALCKGGGDIKNEIFLAGIERPRRRKGLKRSPAKSIISFGDLKFVLDKKWVLAKPAVTNMEEEEINKDIPQFAPCNINKCHTQ